MKINGLEIDILIAEKGLNRAEFAARSGILPQTLQRAIKTGNTRTLTAVKIAKGLGLDVREIIIFDND